MTIHQAFQEWLESFFRPNGGLIASGQLTRPRKPLSTKMPRLGDGAPFRSPGRHSGHADVAGRMRALLHTFIHTMTCVRRQKSVLSSGIRAQKRHVFFILRFRWKTCRFRQSVHERVGKCRSWIAVLRYRFSPLESSGKFEVGAITWYPLLLYFHCFPMYNQSRLLPFSQIVFKRGKKVVARCLRSKFSEGKKWGGGVCAE